MAVKLIDLQLIYGVAGAREKFEDLVAQLVKGEQPKADKVRIMQGDGGIDVHVGELTNPGGIDVYQCKFFPQGLDESQKGQIRKSFQGCRDSDQFTTKKWTLCLPVDLSVDEKRWFEEWRSKQAASGIVIEDPWGATKLEGLLYQEKHRGLREAFFKVDECLRGIAALPTDYAARIQNFLTEYLGTPERPVPFGGRDADLAHLDAWLDDPHAAPYLLLAAPAGRGKSALLVRWVQRLLTRKDLGLAFVPVSIRFRTNLASVIFPALTARLAFLHGDKVPGGPDTSVEMWRGLLTEYLSRPLPDGRRLLLLLDGVDEAADWEPGPDLFPGHPPKGLHVLLSARYRAGDADAVPWLRSLGWDRPELARAQELAPLTAEGVADVLQRMGFPLDRLGQRVDIVAELNYLSKGEPLLVRLYVDDLWARGEAAVRLQPEDLRVIRPGLQGYFDRWWEDQRRLWGNQTPLREPAVQALLNLLACALGPLKREDVLRLVPAGTGLNTWMLEEALRPLARFVLGDGEQQGYVFGHPRLGAFFYEHLAKGDRQATESRFLAWGEETLGALKEGRLEPERSSPYVVQYYGAHLERAGCRVEALLALVSDGWRRSWQALEGTYAGFLNDVERAWQAAGRVNGAQIQTSGSAPFLGAEVRCALCRASVNSLAQNIQPALLKALVVNSVWTPIQGLAYARRIPKPFQRAEALAGLAPYLPELMRSEAVRQALEEARAIADSGERARALADLALHLPESLREEALGQMLEAVQAIADSDDRARALADLTVRLPEPLRRQALEAVRAIKYSELQTETVVGLAPHLPEPLLRQTLEAVQAIADSADRARALSGLAPHLPEPLLRQARCVARTIESPYFRELALMGLVPHLPEPLRDEALGQALEVAQAIKDSDVRAQALALVSLAPHLSEPLLRQALEAAQAIERSDDRAQALVSLAPHLSEPLLRQALEAAQAIKYSDYRARALANLAPHLPEPLRDEALEQALKAAQAIEYPGLRAEGLVGLAPHLPEPLRGQALRQVLETVQVIADPDERAQALAGLAPHLSEPLLRQALEAAQTIAPSYRRAQTLAGLAPHLPEPLFRQALEAAQAIKDSDDRAQALAGLAPHLPEPLRDEALEQALKEVRGIRISYFQATALEGLAPHLSEPLLRQALEAVQAFEDSHWRAPVLVGLAPHLSEPLLRQALEVAQTIEYPNSRARALASLAPHLPEPLRGQALRQALEATRTIKRSYSRAWALAGLVSHLSEPLRSQALRQALETAQAIADSDVRARALAGLAPHLPEPLLRQALEAARAIEDAGYRAEALAVLVLHLPEPLRGEASQQALEAAQIIEYSYDRARALAGLAPHLAKLPPPTLYSLWGKTLPLLAAHTRNDLLDDLRALLPVLMALGGEPAVAEVFRAVQDIGQWWP
jgi:hypothetical protein